MCLSCHSIGGLRNDILTRVEDKNLDDLLVIMETMGEARGFMPPFPGNKGEREALSAYLLDTYRNQPSR